jgi:hypothetical protein
VLAKPFDWAIRFPATNEIKYLLHYKKPPKALPKNLMDDFKRPVKGGACPNPNWLNVI